MKFKIFIKFRIGEGFNERVFNTDGGGTQRNRD